MLGCTIPPPSRPLGLAITSFATLWIAPDALLVILLSEKDVNPSTILCYKYLFAGIVQFIVACVYLKSVSAFFDHARRGGWYCIGGTLSATVVNLW